MVKNGAGFFTMCFGAMLADSEKLWIPLLLMAIGAWLLLDERSNWRR